MAVVLITHDMGVIAGRTDRVLVMYAGKIAEEAHHASRCSPHMRHRYSEALLASVPKLDQDASVPLRSIAGLPPDLSQPIDDCRFAPRCRYSPGRSAGSRAPPRTARRRQVPATSPPASTRWDVDEEHVSAARGRVATARRRTGAEVEPRSAIARQLGPAPKRLEHQQPVLLQVDHLVKEFPVTVGSGAPATRSAGQGRLRRVVRHPPGRDLRPGG